MASRTRARASRGLVGSSDAVTSASDGLVSASEASITASRPVTSASGASMSASDVEMSARRALAVFILWTATSTVTRFEASAPPVARVGPRFGRAGPMFRSTGGRVEPTGGPFRSSRGAVQSTGWPLRVAGSPFRPDRSSGTADRTSGPTDPTSVRARRRSVPPDPPSIRSDHASVPIRRTSGRDEEHGSPTSSTPPTQKDPPRPSPRPPPRATTRRCSKASPRACGCRRGRWARRCTHDRHSRRWCRPDRPRRDDRHVGGGVARRRTAVRQVEPHPRQRRLTDARKHALLAEQRFVKQVQHDPVLVQWRISWTQMGRCRCGVPGRPPCRARRCLRCAVPLFRRSLPRERRSRARTTSCRSDCGSPRASPLPRR